MSREVEVKNIQMTATVPEDLQISLGKLAIDSDPTIAVTEANKAMSLANSKGVLYAASVTAGDGKAAAPESSWDWSTSADISKYYEFGNLMPASSRDGATIFYTADATGVGRTVNAVAKYFAANQGVDANKVGAATKATIDDDTAKATLFAVAARGTDGSASTVWKTSNAYSKLTSWSDTNDDGYYVDIPIWLRSSATEDINISVSGYVLPNSTKEGGSTETELELYKSVRVAILNGDTAGIKDKKTTASPSAVTDGSVCTTSNVLPLVDAWDKTASTSSGTPAKYTTIVGITSPFTATENNTSILDSGIYVERKSLTGDDAKKLYAVNELKTYSENDAKKDLTGHIAKGDTYGEYTAYTAYSGEAIATVKAATSGDGYGEMKKLWIRVWLDGEDEQCWNDNAGQDWAISLRFSRLEIPAN